VDLRGTAALPVSTCNAQMRKRAAALYVRLCSEQKTGSTSNSMTALEEEVEIDPLGRSMEDFHSDDSSSMSDKEGDVDPDSGLDGELDELDNNSNENQKSYIRLTQIDMTASTL
jgi:hypothetical protein